MKKRYQSLVTLALSSFLISAAHAVSVATIGTVNNNDTVVAVYGTGNPDGSWVTATVGDVVVGLRFKERGTANFGATDGLGSTTFDQGTSVNIEFTVGSGTAPLSGYGFTLQVDTDPTAGESWTTIDLTAAYNDNSFGIATTANSAGVEGTWADLAGSNTVAQNSQRTFWVGINGNPSPNPGQYAAVLTAFSTADPSTPIARTTTTLNVVPEPSSLLFSLIGIPLFLSRKRR